MSEAKRSERGLFLYVHQNSDDFHLIFPSQLHRARALQLIEEITVDQSGAAAKVLNLEVFLNGIRSMQSGKSAGDE